MFSPSGSPYRRRTILDLRDTLFITNNMTVFNWKPTNIRHSPRRACKQFGTRSSPSRHPEANRLRCGHLASELRDLSRISADPGKVTITRVYHESGSRFSASGSFLETLNKSRTSPEIDKNKHNCGRTTQRKEGKNLGTDQNPEMG